ncbi:MAG TPA: hypothetical protein VHS32_40295, partial [Streptosporangiaceae bacterium]|nr:hypothetical protein [Streptosporangiaceae bacterium]
MRLVPAALAVALTPAFIAVPTVAFDFPDPPHPVSPKVVSTAIKGVDPGELAGSARPLAVTGGPVGLTPKMAVAVLTPKMAVARFTVAGVSWSRTSVVASKDVTVNVRLKEDSGWTAWERLALPDEGPDTTTAEAARARVGTTPLVSSGATAIQVRLDTATGLTPPELKVST